MILYTSTTYRDQWMEFEEKILSSYESLLINSHINSSLIFPEHKLNISELNAIIPYSGTSVTRVRWLETTSGCSHDKWWSKTKPLCLSAIWCTVSCMYDYTGIQKGGISTTKPSDVCALFEDKQINKGLLNWLGSPFSIILSIQCHLYRPSWKEKTQQLYKGLSGRCSSVLY